MKQKVVCIGEILWDSIPLGLFLGGAPYNVAYHLHNLDQKTEIISKVGDDALGREALRRVGHIGVSTDFIQTDTEFATGFVKVSLDKEGVPKYDIIEPVAWDRIEITPQSKELIKSSSAVVFGTLAQRSKVSRESIQLFADASSLKVVDLNLRPPYDDQDIVKLTLELTDVLKLNQDELYQLKDWFKLPKSDQEAVLRLVDEYELQTVCVTQGAEGAILYFENQWFFHEGYEIDVVDTVGAGDAFLAVLITGILNNVDPIKILDYASYLGAFVATEYGPIPMYRLNNFTDIKSLNVRQKIPNSRELYG